MLFRSLLLETDAPYLSPEPYRGKRNEPALLGFTALEIALLRGENPHELWARCGDNARIFFASRMSVLLPAPDGPTMAVSSPRAQLRSRRRSKWGRRLRRLM